MSEFQSYLRAVDEAATAASHTLGTINFRVQPTPSWDVCLQRLRVLNGQLQRLYELLYGSGTGNELSASASAMGQNELARQIALAKQSVVLPTVSGVDPTLALRTKPIYELTTAQNAAFAAAQTQFPSVFSAAASATTNSAAAVAAVAPPPVAAPSAAAATTASSGASASAPSKLDDPTSAQWLSQSLENALDQYNDRCVSAALRCQTLAKQWSQRSASNIVAMTFSDAAPGAAAPPTGAGAASASGATAASVATAQNQSKRKARELAAGREISGNLRVEFFGQRLK